MTSLKWKKSLTSLSAHLMNPNPSLRAAIIPCREGERGCVREREREGERGRERVCERGGEREREREGVCV